MPLFKCSKCHCVENTACGHYWVEHAHGKSVLCSECGSGEWHGRFPKLSAAGYLVSSDGFLWTKSQVAADLLPKHLKIIGEIGEDGSIRARTEPDNGSL